MKLELIFQEHDTAESCPAVYLAENGEIVVQGQEIDADTKTNLVGVDQGETAVRMSREGFLAAALRYTDRGANPRPNRIS